MLDRMRTRFRPRGRPPAPHYQLPTTNYQLLAVVLLAALILVPRSLLTTVATSETWDEQFHLVRGLALLRGTPAAVGADWVDPPLGEWLVALPLRLAGATLDGPARSPYPDAATPEGARSVLYGQPLSPTALRLLISAWKSAAVPAGRRCRVRVGATPLRRGGGVAGGGAAGGRPDGRGDAAPGDARHAAADGRPAADGRVVAVRRAADDAPRRRPRGGGRGDDDGQAAGPDRAGRGAGERRGALGASPLRRPGDAARPGGDRRAVASTVAGRRAGGAARAAVHLGGVPAARRRAARTSGRRCGRHIPTPGRSAATW